MSKRLVPILCTCTFVFVRMTNYFDEKNLLKADVVRRSLLDRAYILKNLKNSFILFYEFVQTLSTFSLYNDFNNKEAVGMLNFQFSVSFA